MTVPNYQLIGIQLTYDMAEEVKAILATFDPTNFSDMTLNLVKELVCRVHLGYASPGCVPDLVRQSVDWAVNYFEAGDTHWTKGGWFGPLSLGLLLGLLLGEDKKIFSLCSWAKPNRRLHYQGPLEDEIQRLYLVLASLFQEHSDSRFEKVRKKIAACRTRNVRVLSRALEAVANRDDEGFAPAIEACVKHHLTKPKPRPDAHYMEDWLPLHANTIYLAGIRLGLPRPQYAPAIAAYLMTPESVGFST